MCRSLYCNTEHIDTSQWVLWVLLYDSIFTPCSLIPPSIETAPSPALTSISRERGVGGREGSTGASFLIHPPPLLSHNALLQSTEWSLPASRQQGQLRHSVLLCLLLLQPLPLFITTSIYPSISPSVSLRISRSTSPPPLDYRSLAPISVASVAVVPGRSSSDLIHHSHMPHRPLSMPSSLIHSRQQRLTSNCHSVSVSL